MSKRITILATLATIIFLVCSCTPTNHSPVITSLKVETTTLPPSGSCWMECVASDKDNDEISYKWLATKGNIDGNGATATWNAPDSEGIYDVVVKVADDNGGEATGYITITVSVNNPPTITNLKADVDWVTPLSSCRIECDAEDSEGDELNYKWSANEGDISGIGSVITWTAPEAVGLYDIAVVVTDDQGQEDTRSLTVSVALNTPPIIEDLVVTPEEPKCAKKYSAGYRILKGKSSEIECVASDPEDDELSYEWSSDGGSISGKGAVVTWTAPNRKGEVTITVTVSDVEGNKASRSIVFRVETSACAFG